jgi:hypothetical protein
MLQFAVYLITTVIYDLALARIVIYSFTVLAIRLYFNYDRKLQSLNSYSTGHWFIF